MKRFNCGIVHRKRLEKPRLPHPSYPKPLKKELDMTVCIAAIANDGSIFAVSDRMLTSDITLSSG